MTDERGGYIPEDGSPAWKLLCFAELVLLVLLYGVLKLVWMVAVETPSKLSRAVGLSDTGGSSDYGDK